jgi:hypothetical protein
MSLWLRLQGADTGDPVAGIVAQAKIAEEINYKFN